MNRPRCAVEHRDVLARHAGVLDQLAQEGLEQLRARHIPVPEVHGCVFDRSLLKLTLMAIFSPGL